MKKLTGPVQSLISPLLSKTAARARSGLSGLFAVSLAVLVTSSISCSLRQTAPTLPQVDLPAKTPGEISVMAFNVENLFDDVHDEGKNDYTYLPVSKKYSSEVRSACAKITSYSYRSDCYALDWNEKVIEAKMKGIAEVVLNEDGGMGPDILILSEVENERVLRQLNERHLQKAGYTTLVLIDGPDDRGIDIGLLSRLPLKGTPELHRIPYVFSDPKDQARIPTLRGILEVPLELPTKEKLIVFGGHFPSQSNPHEYRVQTLAHLLKLMRERSKTDLVIAGGDFNITAEEDAKSGLLKDIAAKEVLISHFVGCRHCPGTHNYRGGWSYLDALFFSQNLGPDGKGRWVLMPETIDTPRKTANHLYDGGLPRRFDDEAWTGVSDHFPIYARIKPRMPGKPKK